MHSLTNVMIVRIAGTLLMLAQLGLAQTVKSTKSSKLTPEAEFTKTVQPLLSSYCVGCHNPKYKAANLDLAQLTSLESVRTYPKEWRKVAWRLETGDMPPEKTPQPKATAKKSTLRWIRRELARAGQ